MRQAVVAVIPENDKELIGVGGGRQINLNPFVTESPAEVSHSSEPPPALSSGPSGPTLPVAERNQRACCRRASHRTRAAKLANSRGCLRSGQGSAL